MKIRVLKEDGVIEDYKHTKVFGTLNNALSLVNQPCVFTAEQLAEAITFYFYKKQDSRLIKSEQVHLLVMSVLEGTGFQNAAKKLNEHRLNRKIKRNRMEVKTTSKNNKPQTLSKWDKGIIVKKLVSSGAIPRDLARAVASTAEQRILAMEVSSVSTELVNIIVKEQTEAMLTAQRSLEAVAV
jgi:hypothetical protein